MTGYDLRNKRQQIRITQKELAEMMGVTLQSVQHWEQGRRKFKGPAEILFEMLFKEKVNNVRLEREGSR